MVYKILKGNSFYLHVLIDKVEMTWGSRRSASVNVLGLQDLVVKMLGDFYCCETYVLKEVKRTSSEVVCLIPPTMDIGNYSLQVKWKDGEKQLTSKERGIVQIVSDNRQTMVPAGVIDGEFTGLYNLRYYITDDLSTSAIPDNTDMDIRDMDITDINVLKSYMTGDMPMRLRLVDAGKPVGVIDMWSDNSHHQLWQVVQTSYTLENFDYETMTGELTVNSPHSDGRSYVYRRFYNAKKEETEGVKPMTWSRWSAGLDYWTEQKFSSISKTLENLTDDDGNLNTSAIPTQYREVLSFQGFVNSTVSLETLVQVPDSVPVFDLQRKKFIGKKNDKYYSTFPGCAFYGDQDDEGVTPKRECVYMDASQNPQHLYAWSEDSKTFNEVSSQGGGIINKETIDSIINDTFNN